MYGCKSTQTAQLPAVRPTVDIKSREPSALEDELVSTTLTSVLLLALPGVHVVDCSKRAARTVPSAPDTTNPPPDTVTTGVPSTNTVGKKDTVASTEKKKTNKYERRTNEKHEKQEYARVRK